MRSGMATMLAVLVLSCQKRSAASSCTKQATALPALGDGLKAFIACSHTLLMASRQALLEAGHFAYPLHKSS